MKRVFIALKIEPDENLQIIYSTFRSLLGHGKIVWVDPFNIHITLTFLGNTRDDMIKIAEIALTEQCTGFDKFCFNLKGTGVFKSLHDPRIIWIGIENSEEIMKFNLNIVNRLRNKGFMIEERPFKPHLTLGRIKFLKDTESLKLMLEKYKDTLIQKIYVNEVILFESILKPTGPEYKALGRFNLA